MRARLVLTRSVRATFFASAFLSLARTYASAAEPTVDFRRDVLPILSEYCYACHGPDAAARQADLRLDTKDGAFRKDGPVLIPGKSAESELVRRVASTNTDEVMPPLSSKKPLNAKQIETLKKWVDEGAIWGKHWAYEAPVRPALPKVSDAAWPRNGLDYFVLARLDKEGLKPSPEATREQLIRRVTLDLTGLPPTPEEIDTFLADSAPEAYERLVDRLLASPRYGERMAWEWLDAARYADTNGFQGDPTRTMWPWRDWVIRQLNENMPYDQFTIEQIAGDLLPNATREQILATGFNRNHMHNGEGGRIAEETRVENVFDRVETTATVWLGLTFTCCRCHDHKFDPLTQREYYEMAAYFNNTSENGVGRAGATPPALDLTTPEQAAQLAELQPQVAPLEKQIADRETELRPKQAEWEKSLAEKVDTLPENLRETFKTEPDKRPADQAKLLTEHYLKNDPARQELQAKLDKVKNQINGVNGSILRVMVMDTLKGGRETNILVRGAYDKKGEKVGIGTPKSLPPLPPDAPPNRLALARWLVDPANPLTARVTVNRIWQQFFGTGLVKTVEDFGVQGELPSHPELLDWLAEEVEGRGSRDEGLVTAKDPSSDITANPLTSVPRPSTLDPRPSWDIKRLHRLLVTSATYRQSSKVTPALVEKDPENRLLARGARFRLPAFMIRDQALAAAGLLVERSGGPSVNPYQPPGIWEEATFGKQSYNQDHGDKLYRRSLYTFWKRIVGPTMFFDSATRQTCTVKQVRTNTPLHALATLNDITYVEAARALAQQAMLAAPTTPERIAYAFRRLTSRLPSEKEQQILTTRFDQLKARYAADQESALKLLKVGESPRNESLDPIDHAALTSLGTLMLNLDEVVSKQ
ncbi:MAG: PSD1 domain-containing protein [Planctomycetaceae bacterium]|nr:PSD1 domain-containing protein [Planctomycetaceae bacterium]